MPRLINDEQFRAVCGLPPADRYRHFVEQIADWQEVWGLRDAEGWATVGDADGAVCLPVWPHARYAIAYGEVEFPTMEATAMPVSEWLDKWLPGMQEDGTFVAVFPVRQPGNKGVVVEPMRLIADLQVALQQYE